jgi:predicted Rossmann fold flavoprotein
METCDVLVIGAGAAGMMCAIEAAKRKRRVTLLDHSDRIGRKILISGGGRCNFTNINTSADSFVSQNPHFCKSALAQYTPQDFIALVKKHRIKFHEKKLGQLFCDESATNIVNMLTKECRDAGVKIELSCKTEAVEKNNNFTVKTNRGTYAAESLVIATGGLSVPQTGATGFGYEIARQFGLRIIEPIPALDGFNFNGKELKHFKDLAGVSLDVLMQCNGAAFRENILFTHNGLSGPASLQASLYWKKPLPLVINLLPNLDPYEWLSEKQQEKPRSNIKNVLSEVLPKRFAEYLCHSLSFDNNLSSLPLKELAKALHSWQIVPSGTVGFRKAEVTKGGVDTNELSSKSMESKKLPGLYFIGEVVDVTGQLGGYNFQWAWSSGFAAGQRV